RQGPGQMLAWDTLSSDVDVIQKAEASLAFQRFSLRVSGGGGGGGVGGGIGGGVPGGFGGVGDRVTVAGAAPPASGPAAAATGGSQSGQLGNTVGKDLAGNESRFGVIHDEMLAEQAQAAPSVNSYAFALTPPPPAAMPPPASPALQRPVQ